MLGSQAFETSSSHVGKHENFLRASQSQTTGQLRFLTLKAEGQQEHSLWLPCRLWRWPMSTLRQHTARGAQARQNCRLSCHP